MEDNWWIGKVTFDLFFPDIFRWPSWAAHGQAQGGGFSLQKTHTQTPARFWGSQTQVQGLHGLEHYELVNIGALQNSCELPGDSATGWALRNQTLHLFFSQKKTEVGRSQGVPRLWKNVGDDWWCCEMLRYVWTYQLLVWDVEKTDLYVPGLFFFIIEDDTSLLLRTSCWSCFPLKLGQASDFQLPESVTVDTMLQHRRQREQKERLKRLEPAKRRGSAACSLKWSDVMGLK